MTVRRTIGFTASIVGALVALAAGCKRSTPASTGDAAPLATSTNPAAATGQVGVPTQLSRGIYEGHADAGDDAEPPLGPAGSQVIDVSRTEIVQAPGAASAPPPVDPFVAPIDAVRRSAVGCFAGQPPGTYSATITISVTAGGLVGTVEVSPGNVTDDGVIGCLKQAGEGGRFPSVPGGRTVTVDVNVRG